MATGAAAPREQDLDPGNAILERKRPHDVITCDDASNTDPAHSASRKRAKKTGKLGHQDVRDFVPVGATFSTSVVPIEAQSDGDDVSGVESDPESEVLSEYEPFGASRSDSAEQQKALVEGRRLLIRDLPPNATEEHLSQFFKDYSIEKIWLPDRKGDESQTDTTAQKNDLSVDGEFPNIDTFERAAISSTNDGRRLYVGNLPYSATVEDLREFFTEFSIENVTIPVNPRTCRPVGYAFVTVSTSDEADRAASQLSGKEILERKVSIQRARAEEKKAPDPSNTAAKEVASATKSKHMEDYHGDTCANGEKAYNESEMFHEVSRSISPQDAQAAPPVSWNAVNTTKIRTTLGGSFGKVKDLVDEPRQTNGGEEETERRSNRDIATSVALERVKGLQSRLSSMDPLDGPVSAYKLAQQELHNAEVDYNYCLYFPNDESFQSPPLSIPRNSIPKNRYGSDYRLCLWSQVEQCMKDGNLQALKEGRIPVSSPDRLHQSSPAQSEQLDSQKDLQISPVTDPRQIQVLGKLASKATFLPRVRTSTPTNAMTSETQETYNKQHNYLRALPKMKPGTHSYEKMKKKVRENEIHLNYCKYFPVAEDYLPLALAKKGLNELNSLKIDGTRAIEHRAAQIWKLVEQCTQDGMLQELKDGQLAAWLKDAPPPNQSFFASALQAKHPQGTTVHRSKPPYSGRPQGAGNGDVGATTADLKPMSKVEGASNDRQAGPESDEEVILNLDYEDQDIPSMSEDGNVRLAMKSENKTDELLSDADADDTKPNLPAISPANEAINTSDSGTESNDSSMVHESQSEDDDAMMQYSSSERIVADDGGRDKKTVAPPIQSASVLADLSPHDLNAQLRYFHTTKAREEVDRKTPVRCLVCAKEGHMAGFCESLTCSSCGAFNQHTTKACPDNAKCAKCREQGHDDGHCPYKLKKLPRHEIVCDLCQRNGHIEDDCELVWRTSGRPWESDLAHTDVRLSCYECGHPDHLGNECSSRRPNKAMGTSTWDGNMGPVSIKSTREIKIKGKATRQDPINLDDSDNELANFYRAKVPLPEPGRRGQIRIVTGRQDSPVYEPSWSGRSTYADHQNGSPTFVNDTYGNSNARQPYQGYQDWGRGNWRAVDGPDYATGYDDLRYNDDRFNERRSRSPPYRDRKGYVGGNSWPSPRTAPRVEQRDRRPRTDANVYRPMPSAAQNAWVRRRL